MATTDATDGARARARAREIPAAFERRAARAARLAPEAESAEEPLRFAAELYRAQGALASAVVALADRDRLRGVLCDDLEGLVEPLRQLLRRIGAQAPPALADEARALAEGERASLRSRLVRFWRHEPEAPPDYLARALLRPYGEILAATGIRPDRPSSPGACPFCGGRPWIAVRRPPPSGSGAGPGVAQGGVDGAERALACSLCGTEWGVGRIRCPACSEEDPTRLPSFQSDRHAAARIEACESCRAYVKSIDLTLDARPIPEVDDLVSLALDLWAGEAGYRRIEPGLAGI